MWQKGPSPYVAISLFAYLKEKEIRNHYSLNTKYPTIRTAHDPAQSAAPAAAAALFTATAQAG